MALFSRTSDANEPPLRDPLQTDEQGRLNSFPWIKFLSQLYRGVRFAYELGAAQSMQDDTRRDFGPDIAQAVAVDRDPAAALALAGIQDLQKMGGDTPRPENQQFRDSAVPKAYDAEIEELRRLAWQQDTPVPRQAATLIEDTHANRANYAAASYPDGTMYYETDRKVYYIDQAGVWKWFGGVMRGTLSPDQKPGDLGTDDTGFRFDSTDFYHEYRWNSSGWEYTPSDPGSRWFILGGAPDRVGAMFVFCDTSVVQVANSDGTLSNFTTPDSRWGDFLQLGSYGGTPDAATTPKWDTGAVTDSKTISANAIVAQGALATLTLGVVNVDPHQHTLSDANAKIKAPSETNGGLPSRLKVALYVRI